MPSLRRTNRETLRLPPLPRKRSHCRQPENPRRPIRTRKNIIVTIIIVAVMPVTIAPIARRVRHGSSGTSAKKHPIRILRSPSLRR